MHPHHDKLHVRRQYRRHIMDCKRKWGSARGLIHYRAIIETYLWTKASNAQLIDAKLIGGNCSDA